MIETPNSVYETLLEFVYLAPVGLIKFAADGTVGMANPKAAQLLMPLAMDGDIANIYQVLSPLFAELRHVVESFQPAAGPVCDQVQMSLPGTRLVLTLGVNKIDDDTFMAVIQDISGAVALEARIKDEQERLRAIFDNIRDYAIFTVGQDGRIDGWNRSLERLGGWQVQDVMGVPASRLLTGMPSGTTEAAIINRISDQGTAEFEGRCLRKDGTAFWGNTVATALPDRDGNPSGYVIVTRDLTERKHMEDQLAMLAATDPLTGALNRRAGEENLTQSFLRWQTYQKPFAVLMIDCDHFKKVNDTYGHDTGDRVLQAVVRLCKLTMRAFDVIIRWGGEEFLVLLQECSVATALSVAERVRMAIADEIVKVADNAVRVTASIGVGRVTDEDPSADHVIKRADRFLYQAKHAGRNRVVAA